MSEAEDRDEALVARWETVGYDIFTEENVAEFARIIELARRGVASGLPVVTGDDVEIAARAACSEGGDNPDYQFINGQYHWERFSHYARAIINAMGRTGWKKIEPGCVVVPVEPTEAMLASGKTAVENCIDLSEDFSGFYITEEHRRWASVAYRAMVNAATKSPAGEGEAS